MNTFEKLKILADSAKYDVSCSSSGSSRRGGKGSIGNASKEGICHSWAADGRCISLLKVLLSNDCVYECKYCVNRHSADVSRASFEPRELADLTMEFYRRNYIEGLFLSSAVEVSPDHTAEKILCCLQILRDEYLFAGYIHAKIIPGVSPELLHRIGLYADRLSVNIEMPTQESLSLYAPQKKPKAIFQPMRQITNTLIERSSLVGPGTMFKNQNINTPSHYISKGSTAINSSADTFSRSDGYSSAEYSDNAVGGGLPVPAANLPSTRRHRQKELFAPAGQTTQMIIGAGDENDRQIIFNSESLYRIFKMKRVYFSAYVPVTDSPLLPERFSPPPLLREHRLYQADWLLRFYGFTADEILPESSPFLDTELDPKISWALRNIHLFPMEVNKVSKDELMRIPGIGALSALRIIRQRKVSSVRFEDLKKMGVVLKRAKYFITCEGKYMGKDFGLSEPDPGRIKPRILQGSLPVSGLQVANAGSYPVPQVTANTFSALSPDWIRNALVEPKDGEQLSMFCNAAQ